MDAAFAFARTIAKTSYEDLPQAAVEAAKKSILDTLGTILAGSTQGQGCQQVVELVKEGGGTPESTVLVFGGKVPCHMAGLANGAMSHTLDFDDISDEGGIHPGIMTIPAALAVAERVKANGKAFLTAVALGEDMACRFGRACHRSQVVAWLPAHLHGTFSGAAAAGKLLGLSEDGLVNTLGIALAQASGSLESALSPGSVLRGLYAGFTSKAAILAALMAQKGITGSSNSLEGKAGLFNAFYLGRYDRDALLAGLGEVFQGAASGFKPWPACRETHTFIEATLTLVTDHDIAPEEIVEIKVYAEKRGLCEPLEERRRPATAMDGKFSIPYCVAVAAAKRAVGIADFTPQGLSDPKVLAMAQKVTPVVDPSVPEQPTTTPAVVEIFTRPGRTFSKRVDFARGHRSNPMSKEEIAQKFRGCAAYSAKPLSAATIDRVIDLVFGVEEVEDVSVIAELL